MDIETFAVGRPVNFCKEDCVKNYYYYSVEKTYYVYNLNTKEGKRGCLKTTDEVVRVIFNKNATIVILPDGTKGVSKCCPIDYFDENAGVRIAHTRARIKSLQKQLKSLTKW
jgi:hypothetical protein